jgi:uracil-xanthine permease
MALGNAIDVSGPMGGVEERPGVGALLLLGIQHVLVSNVWLDPVFVAAVAGLPAALAANMVNAIFLAAGLVTLAQSTRLVRLPIVEGPSAAFDPLMITFARAGRLAAATTGIFTSALVILVLALSGLLGRLRALFTPAVAGSVILLVGLALARFTLVEVLGGNPGSPAFASPPTVAIAAMTMASVLALTLFGRGAARRYAFLWALLVGDAVAALLGRLDVGAVREARWVGIPRFLPYGGVDFQWGVTVAFFLAFLVAVVEAVGVYYAAGEIVGTEITPERLTFGVAGEAAGSAVSTLFGGFATTAYAQNVGLLQLTGVATRHAVTASALLFLILALIPKLGALLAATPDPVVGGLFLPAAGSVVMAGIRTLRRMEWTPAAQAVAGLSLMVGTGLPALGDPLLRRLGPVWGILLGQQVVVGAVVAIVLQMLLVEIPAAARRAADGRDAPTPHVRGRERTAGDRPKRPV